MTKENTTCPFCYATAPWGATVCRGCHAVLEYGASSKWYLGALAVSIFISVWISDFLSWWLSVLAGFICFAYLAFLLVEKFENKVVFRRNH